MLSWVEPLAEGGRLRASFLTGASWSPPIEIVASPALLTMWADVPAVLAVGGTNLIAQWPHRPPDQFHGYHVRVSTSTDNGATWSAPARPYTDDSPTEHGFASLFQTRGETSIAWLDGRRYASPERGAEQAATELRIRAVATTDLGAVVAHRVCDCCQTAVTQTSNGPVIAFRGRSDDEIRDIYTTQPTASGWRTPRRVSADGWRVTACPVNGPAIDSHGDHVGVAWYTVAEGNPVVRAAFRAPGRTHFTRAIDVDQQAPLGRVALTMIAPDVAVLVWLRQASDNEAALMMAAVRQEGSTGDAIELARLNRRVPIAFPRIAPATGFVHVSWIAESTLATVRTAVAPFL